MALPRDLVIEVLRAPQCCVGFSLREWDLLIRQARSADLLARLAWTFKDLGLRDAVPPAPAAHLDAALRVAGLQHAEVRREVGHVLQALSPLGVRPVLLKGAAYVMGGLPAARGRVFSDLDILVPRERLGDVEAALMQAGWATTHHSAYDQRYYREWMHELPPMVHMRRQTALDVHHGIAPLTGRWKPPSAALLAAAGALPRDPRLAILAPVDLVLHSMVHLLLNEEFSHALRDVSDLDLLLRHFGGEREFWVGFGLRVEQLGLQRAAGHGLALVAATLNTPIPAKAYALAAVWVPLSPVVDLLRRAWERALRSPHPSADDAWTTAARALLYVRAHALRMPPLMLAHHLVVKALGLHLRSASKPT